MCQLSSQTLHDMSGLVIPAETISFPQIVGTRGTFSSSLSSRLAKTLEPESNEVWTVLPSIELITSIMTPYM